MARNLPLLLVTGALLVGAASCNRKKTPDTQADLLRAQEEKRDRDQDRTGGPDEIPTGTGRIPQ